MYRSSENGFSLTANPRQVKLTYVLACIQLPTLIISFFILKSDLWFAFLIFSYSLLGLQFIFLIGILLQKSYEVFDSAFPPVGEGKMFPRELPLSEISFAHAFGGLAISFGGTAIVLLVSKLLLRT